MGLRFDSGRDADEDRLHAGGAGACRFVQCIEHDERARRGSRAQLLVRLVVAVENEPVARDAGPQRELQLAARGDIGTKPFRGEESHQCDVRKRLRPVHDERVRIHTRVRVRAREDRLAAIDDEGRPEGLGQRRRAHPAQVELAAVDDGRGGKEVDQPRRVSRSTSCARGPHLQTRFSARR